MSYSERCATRQQEQSPFWIAQETLLIKTEKHLAEWMNKTKNFAAAFHIQYSQDPVAKFTYSIKITKNSDRLQATNFGYYLLSKSTLQWERLTWVPGPGRAVPGRGWRYRSQIGRRVPRESRSWQEKVTKEGWTHNRLIK